LIVLKFHLADGLKYIKEILSERVKKAKQQKKRGKRNCILFKALFSLKRKVRVEVWRVLLISKK
jgi:hypothetical protein